jgi:hypothetical protein
MADINDENIKVILSELRDARNREESRDHKLEAAFRSMADTLGSSIRDLIINTRSNEKLNGNGNGKVTFQTMFTVIAALAAVGFIMLSGTQVEVEKFSGVEARVQGIEKTLFGEQERNTKIENNATANSIEDREWRVRHDREVILINTSQTIGIEHNYAMLCTLWEDINPMVNCPDMQPQPRISP